MYIRLCFSETLYKLYGRDGVSNHQPRDCLRSRLIRYRSKKTPKLGVLGLRAGNSQGIQRSPVNSPQIWPITRNIFPFDDVIIGSRTQHIILLQQCFKWSKQRQYLTPEIERIFIRMNWNISIKCNCGFIHVPTFRLSNVSLPCSGSFK